MQRLKVGVVELTALTASLQNRLKSGFWLAELPLLDERKPEIREVAFVAGRQRRTTTIALMSSLGCPYSCDFCSEWATAYTAFGTDWMAHELDVIATRYPGAIDGGQALPSSFGLRVMTGDRRSVNACSARRTLE